MCGITGIINKDRNSKFHRDLIVKKMNDAIIHRGPDSEGSFSDDFCSLAMRRLSIIDLNSGNQPIFNEDKTILVFLNGEIYNYLILKADLQEKNHIFSTTSDTEVLVHLYEEFGTEMVYKLNGMFSFCIYDIPNNKWLLARDRFGEKPLYFYQYKNHFSFSSEINSLLEDDLIPRKLDRNSLIDYLSNSIVPDPKTLINDVFSLEAGSYMNYDGQHLQIKKYFSPSYNVNTHIKTTEDCIDLLNPLLIKAVKSQMISDVPLGAFLSGGIDSSTIVANMQMNSSKPIKTFTVKFDNSSYDESGIAKEVSNYLGTDHTEIFIRNKNFSEDIFWKIIKHVGLPFCDSSAIPTFFITEEIRKNVKVALSGDGGDEIFAGYPIYSWWPNIDKLRSMPNGLSSFYNRILEITGLNSTNKGRSLYRAFLAAKGSSNEIGARISILFSDVELKYLTNGITSDFSNFSKFPHESISWTGLQKALYYRIKYDLPSDMLIKVDRMSMANSLEVRAPFLDSDLFEAVSHIPSHLFLQKGKNKYLLRKMMETKLPKSVFEHPKTGFSIPLHDYFNDEFKRLCDEQILNNKKMLAIFNFEALEFFVKRGLTQKVDNSITVYRASHQLWALLQLGGWLNYFNIDVSI